MCDCKSRYCIAVFMHVFNESNIFILFHFYGGALVFLVNPHVLSFAVFCSCKLIPGISLTVTDTYSFQFKIILSVNG